MKAILLLVGFGVITASTSHGQGSVSFANTLSSRVYLCDGTTPVPIGNRFTAELAYAPDGTPSDVFFFAATRVGATTTFGPVGGLFNGGGRTVTQLSPAGGLGLFQVRVWE